MSDAKTEFELKTSFVFNYLVGSVEQKKITQMEIVRLLDMLKRYFIEQAGCNCISTISEEEINKELETIKLQVVE
ncbi:hypothetical protein LCGC14_0359750 [marine sediment metagenome]|uniref:Uncharacterized protein n=1 Tax=marine sediment metagenome TaxID=412755 RepID=A0A0F9VVF2_9ZZZZ